MRCPRCHESVRLPDAAADAVVRCPWCREEYELGEAEAGLPPMLEVIQGGTTAAVTDSSEASGLGFNFAGLERDSGPSISEGPSNSEGQAFSVAGEVLPDAAAVRSAPVRPGTRRRQANPVVGLLKVVGGGVAGIFLALMILQVIGRAPNLGMWPFQGPGSPMWGALRSDASSGGRRAVAPRPVGDGRRDASRGANADRGGEGAGMPLDDMDESPRGRTLELPDDPAFATDVTEEDGLSSEPLGQAVQALSSDWESYQQAREANAPAEELQETALRIGELLRELGLVMHGAGRLSLEQQALVDSTVIAMAGDLELLKRLIPAEVQAVREADAEGVAGRYALGVIVEDADRLWIRGAKQDSARREVELALAELEVPRDRPVLVLGADEGEDSALRIYYARPLR